MQNVQQTEIKFPVPYQRQFTAESVEDWTQEKAKAFESPDFSKSMTLNHGTGHDSNTQRTALG